MRHRGAIAHISTSLFDSAKTKSGSRKRSVRFGLPEPPYGAGESGRRATAGAPHALWPGVTASISFRAFQQPVWDEYNACDPCGRASLPIRARGC